MFTGVARDAARLGSAYGALASDCELHGVAIWLAPGRFPWSAFRQLRGLDAVRSACRSAHVSSVHGDGGERGAPSSCRPALVPGDDGRRSRGPAPGPWRPVDGTSVLKIADRDNVDCYLETAEPGNAEYYARHGFVVENRALQLVPNGPAHIAMRRRAAAASGSRTDEVGSAASAGRLRRHGIPSGRKGDRRRTDLITPWLSATAVPAVPAGPPSKRCGNGAPGSSSSSVAAVMARRRRRSI